MLKQVTLLAVASLLVSCTAVKLGIANVPARLARVDRHAALRFGDGVHQVLDVYAPHEARAAPVVVFWYGGGFVSGRREQYRFVGAALAERGIVAILPDYGLYPPAVFPSFVNDAALAVHWASQHAAKYGGDPQRMFLMGHSAGGYLASLVALDRRYLAAVGESGLRLRGFIALSAPHVLNPNTEQLRTIFAPPSGIAAWQPRTYASSDAPPALLIHGAADQLVGVEQSEQLAAALRTRGAVVKLLVLPGRSHTDTLAALSVPLRARAPVLAETVEFVQRLSAN